MSAVGDHHIQLSWPHLAGEVRPFNSGAGYCTVSVTVPVSVVAPEVPVTVTVYVPAVVPGLLVPPPPPPVLPPPPPHASTPLASVTRSINIPSIVCHLRRRAGMPKSRMHARVVPPVTYHGTPGRFGWTRAALVAAVVVIVSVAVPAVLPEMLSGVVEPKLTVGGY